MVSKRQQKKRQRHSAASRKPDKALVSLLSVALSSLSVKQLYYTIFFSFSLYIFIFCPLRWVHNRNSRFNDICNRCASEYTARKGNGSAPSRNSTQNCVADTACGWNFSCHTTFLLPKRKTLTIPSALCHVQRSTKPQSDIRSTASLRIA